MRGLLFAVKMDTPCHPGTQSHTTVVVTFSSVRSSLVTVTWSRSQVHVHLVLPPCLPWSDQCSDLHCTSSCNPHGSPPVIPILLMRKLRLTLVMSNSIEIQIWMLEFITGGLYRASGSLNLFLLSLDVTEKLRSLLLRSLEASVGDRGRCEQSRPCGIVGRGRRVGGAPGLPRGRGSVTQELMEDGKRNMSVRERSVAFQTCQKRHASQVFPSRISAGKK